MKHILYIMYSAAHAATRSACTATLLLLAGACSSEIAQEIAPDQFPADGRLAIGRLTIATDNPNTRVATGAESWETNDCIRLTATGTDGAPLLAYYIYKENKTWEQEDLGSNPGDPASTYPLYIDAIDHTKPIRIDSWGGRGDDAEKADLTIYTDQGAEPDGSIYHANDHLACPAATLHTAADAAAGITRGSVSGTLTHQRVDVVVRVLTDAAHPLSAKSSDTQLHFTLNNSTGNADATVWSWMQGSTPATSTQKAYTTFRAYLKLRDVPGAGDVQTDATGSKYVVVAGTSPLATLSYATQVGGITLPGSGKLNLNYKVQTTDGQTTHVRPGTRLVVTVDFTTLQNPVLTASIEPWTTVDEGEVGTLPGIAQADGTEPLNLDLFNAARTTWIVTGGGTPEIDAIVLNNVRDALNRIHAPFDAEGNPNPAYTGTARIDLQLPEVTTLPMYTFPQGNPGAFTGYEQLRSISAPRVTSIGYKAFNNCKALTTISLPQATTIENFAFRGCVVLTTLSLPEATSIGDYAFNSCAALTRLELSAAGSITLNAQASASFWNYAACTLVLNPDKAPGAAGKATPKVSADGKWWGSSELQVQWLAIDYQSAP